MYQHKNKLFPSGNCLMILHSAPIGIEEHFTCDISLYSWTSFHQVGLHVKCPFIKTPYQSTHQSKPVARFTRSFINSKQGNTRNTNTFDDVSCHVKGNKFGEGTTLVIFQVNHFFCQRQMLRLKQNRSVNRSHYATCWGEQNRNILVN